MKKKDIVIEMFKKNYSSYTIHLETGLSFKEITHYIREDDELSNKHKSEAYKRRQEYNTLNRALSIGGGVSVEFPNSED